MAKAAAVIMLVMTLIASTYTTPANGFDVVSSGRSLMRLQYFSYIDPRGLSTVEVGAAPASSTTGGSQAPAPSPNNGGNKQSWGSWFEQKMGSVSGMFGSSGNSGAPAPAPSA